MSFEKFIASTRAFIAARERRADRRWLLGLIDGSPALLSADTFLRLEPMFTKYADDADMMALLERAAQAYGDAAMAAAAWVRAELAIKDARRSSRG